MKLNRKAVYGKSMRGHLYLNPTNTGGHSILRLPNIPDASYLDVDFVSLADVLEGNRIISCDLLKMNCEGAEFSIILETPKHYLKNINKIAMEYHEQQEGNRIESLASRLQESGFRVRVYPFQSYPVGMLYAWR